MRTNVLVTGANGQLAKTLQKRYKNNQDHIKFTFVTKKELDITDAQQVQSYFLSNNFKQHFLSNSFQAKGSKHMFLSKSKYFKLTHSKQHLLSNSFQTNASEYLFQANAS